MTRKNLAPTSGNAPRRLAAAAFALTLAASALSPAAAFAYMGFSDVTGSEWYATDEYLGYVVDHGLMTGYSDGTFGGSNTVTRAEAITVLWRIAGEPIVSAEPFDDVAPGLFYTEAVAWARANGITTGYDGTNDFRPAQPVLREEFVTFMGRYAESLGMYVGGAGLNMYKDAGKVSRYALSSVQWAINWPILSGKKTDEGAFIDPQGMTERGEMAKMIAALHRDVLGVLGLLDEA